MHRKTTPMFGMVHALSHLFVCIGRLVLFTGNSVCPEASASLIFHKMFIGIGQVLPRKEQATYIARQNVFETERT